MAIFHITKKNKRENEVPRQAIKEKGTAQWVQVEPGHSIGTKDKKKLSST